MLLFYKQMQHLRAEEISHKNITKIANPKLLNDRVVSAQIDLNGLIYKSVCQGYEAILYKNLTMTLYI